MIKIYFMKKMIAFVVLSISIAGCNSGDINKNGVDSGNTQTPTAIQDTSTQHPNGVTSDGVISTDTAAFGVNAMNADTSNKGKKKD